MNENIHSDISNMLTPGQIRTARAACSILDTARAVLLSEPTGTGKTYIACAIAAHFMRMGHSAAAVVPAHLMNMWRLVFKKFKIDIALFSYQCASLGKLPQTDEDDMLWLMDEAHMLKNPDTKRFAALLKQTAPHRVCLITATPLTRTPRDLHSLAILCGYPPGQTYFRMPFVRGFLHALMPESRTDPISTGITAEIRRSEFRTAIASRDMLEALMDEIAQIPWHVMYENGKIEDARIVTHVVVQRLFSHRNACLATLRKLENYYRAARQNCGNTLLTRRDFYRFMGITGTQKLLPFAECIYGRTIDDDQRGDLEQSLKHLQTAKRILEKICTTPDHAVAAVQTLIDEIPEGDAAVLFTQFSDTAAHYAKNLHSNGKIALLTAQNAEYQGIRTRRDIIENMFDPGADQIMLEKLHLRTARVLICSDAFACGHNLHRASRLIHLDLPWTPAEIRQREGRIIRKGQNAADILIAHPKYRDLPHILEQYQNERFRRLRTRMKMMQTWNGTTPPFDEILTIRARNFPEYWARCHDRWIPVAPRDAQISPLMKCTISSFGKAFPAINREMRQPLSQIWKQTKMFCSDDDVRTCAADITRLARTAAIWPKISREFLDRHLGTTDQTYMTVQNIMMKLRNIPTIPLPSDNTPCQIYTASPQIPPPYPQHAR